MRNQRELTIIEVKRRHRDLCATIFFFILTFSYILMIWFNLFKKTSTVNSRDKANNQTMWFRDNHFSILKTEKSKDAIDNSTAYIFNIIRWPITIIYTSIVMLLLIFLVYLDTLDISKFYLFLLIVLLSSIYFLLTCFQVPSLTLFFMTLYTNYPLLNDIRNETRFKITSTKSSIIQILKAFLLIAPLTFVSAYFIIFQILNIFNLILNENSNIFLLIFLVYYFMISLFVCIFTLSLYYVTFFYFFIHSFEVSDLLQVIILSFLNVFYTFGSICFYSITFCTYVISKVSTNTVQSIIDAEITNEGLISIIYTILLYTLVPFTPFMALFSQDSLDFIVCLGFFSKSYKQTKEKLLSIRKNIVLKTLKSIFNSNILLGALVFAVNFAFFVLFQIYILQEYNQLVHCFVLCNLLVFNCLIMVMFNSYISILQYIFIFMKKTLDHNNNDLFSLINSERYTLFVGVV